MKYVLKEAIPWKKIKPGMILMNYGHVYHLQIHFVKSVHGTYFKSDYLQVEEMGDVDIKINRVVDKDTWNYWANKFKNDVFNDKAILYDVYRTHHLRDLILQAFTTGIRLNIY